MKTFFEKLENWEIKVFYTSFSEELKKLKPWKYEFKFEKIKKTRSILQNSLYWKWLSILEEHSWSWYTADEFHKDIFQKNFLKSKIKSEKDKRRKIEIVRSTTNLNTEEFSIYLQKIQKLAKDFFKINLEFPNDFLLIDEF